MERTYWSYSCPRQRAVQRTKLCRCEVSHGSVAMARNRHAAQKNRGSGSVTPAQCCRSQSIHGGRVSRVAPYGCRSSVIVQRVPSGFRRRPFCDVAVIAVSEPFRCAFDDPSDVVADLSIYHNR
ncbi:hypothetical protein EVAR_4339_1 [Eumeta japonica]|uniref:Uncharacterized protein n=1 Tax=Eumeta variegata TaxID=151549 RepID=A0A4C1VEX3_EUMVA|nr:hypothetical protein EVAR_4339_1 [Eumeta japonica]